MSESGGQPYSGVDSKVPDVNSKYSMMTDLDIKEETRLINVLSPNK
jgi:hypothetical protein